MIKRLRKRFIRIATLAVTGVMLVLCIALNTANFLSVRAEQQRMAIQPCRKGVQLRFHAASPPFIASAARFLRILRSTSRETTTSAASIISARIRISTGRWRVIKGM